MPVKSRITVALIALASLGGTASPAAAATVSAPDGTRAQPVAARTVRQAGSAGADPRTGDAWHLASDGPLGVRTGWAHTTGGDVTVAILDTGIDTGHPDLAPNLWTNPGEIPGNGWTTTATASSTTSTAWTS